jgi:dienelactone hydrolase
MTALLLLFAFFVQQKSSVPDKLPPSQSLTEKDWQSRRTALLDGLQKVMGPLPQKSSEPLDLRIESEENLDRVVRKRITFVAEKGDRVPAYLLLPKNSVGKRPAMLCLHQTVKIGKGEPVGLGGKPNLRYALELAERGYVTLAPDDVNFGDYKIDCYAQGYASATMKGIVNHRRAIDLLQSLPQVDGSRIGVIGHSRGGHNALFLAAFDERVKVVVTSCGFTSFPRYKRGDLTGWSHKGYMPRIANDFGKDPKRMPFDFPELLAALAPRAVFVNAPTGDDNFDVTGVRDCVRSASPAYESLKAKDRLVAVHPECGHDFPPDVRKQASEFVDRVLK